MDIKLILNSMESELFEPLLNESFNINTTQLYNIAVYMDVVKKSKNVKKVISNQNNILQACNYDSDDNLDYWVVLDQNFNFTDIGIPQNIDTDNAKSFENIPEFESNLIKTIKNNEN